MFDAWIELQRPSARFHEKMLAAGASRPPSVLIVLAAIADVRKAADMQ